MFHISCYVLNWDTGQCLLQKKVPYREKEEEEKVINMHDKILRKNLSFHASCRDIIIVVNTKHVISVSYYKSKHHIFYDTILGKLSKKQSFLLSSSSILSGLHEER